MVRRRRNFLPTFIFNIFLWLCCLLILFFIPPDNLLSIFSFLFFLWLALALTFSLILVNSRRGFLFSLLLILFLILNWQKLANVLNIILLTTFVLILELYFTKRK